MSEADEALDLLRWQRNKEVDVDLTIQGDWVATVAVNRRYIGTSPLDVLRFAKRQEEARS